MATFKEENEEVPVFDRTRISHRDSKRGAVLQARLRAANDDPDEIEACLDEMDAFFAKFLVSVPRSWLVPDAPQALDWSDPDSLNWLQGDRWNDLASHANPQVGEKKGA